ncbi:MAG TPA: hypothetical protein V6C81_26885 [Planktothrix sp.]|jgi:adenosine deaminase
MTDKQVKTILAFLDGNRQLRSLKKRFRTAVESLKGRRLTRAELRKVFKGNIHDHIDCFPEYYTLLSKWHQLYDFDFGKVKFPEGVRAYWKMMNFDPSAVAFPAEVISLWRGEGLSLELTGHARAAALRKNRQDAARQYGQFLVGYGSGSLFQYVQAIVVHILPVMQNAEPIELIMKQRLASAKKNGERVVELRGAPQLHTWNGMSMEDALLTYIAGIQNAEIPVGLIVCALRHEDPTVAWELAKLAIKYRKMGVTTFDLAADEASNPGVLRWWVKPALLALLGGLKLTVHLWETNEPTDDDIRCLDAFDNMLALAKRTLTRLGIDVRSVLGAAEADADISRLLDSVIAFVLDDKTVPFEGRGMKVVFLPDLHLPAREAKACQPEEHSQPAANRIGHGIRGRRQGNRFCEVCVSSNIVTGQVKSVAVHPIHDMWDRGVNLFPCTDGTTLIGIKGLVDEFALLQDNGWDASRFLICGMLCVMATSFGAQVKTQLARECVESYEGLLK